MNVRLVSMTHSAVEGLSPEELIVYVARVSNPENQLNKETSDRLLSYLIKHRHWSPFEMVDMTVEIVTSRAIAQQIIRHRSFSFQEFSQRYSEVQTTEPISLRYKAEKNRQSSSDTLKPSDKNYFDGEVRRLNESANTLYNEMLSHGIAKECARFVLPLSTQTRLYMKGSIRSWIHYLQIRCEENTQLEHREIAEEIRRIFEERFPMIAKSL